MVTPYSTAPETLVEGVEVSGTHQQQDQRQIAEIVLTPEITSFESMEVVVTAGSITFDFLLFIACLP